MATVPEMIPLSDLGPGADGIMKLLSESGQPLVLTQGGRPAAVLLTIEAYERAEDKLQLMKAIAQSEREIAAGLTYDLETVMAEADALLAEGQP